MSAADRKPRVLVIEDEGILAIALEDMLIDLGYEVGVVAARMEDALREAGTGSFDVAILDINIDGSPSYPVADLLKARGIAFAFATGYGTEGLAPAYAGTPMLRKPFAQSELEAVLTGIVGATPPSSHG